MRRWPTAQILCGFAYTGLIGLIAHTKASDLKYLVNPPYKLVQFRERNRGSRLLGGSCWRIGATSYRAGRELYPKTAQILISGGRAGMGFVHFPQKKRGSLVRCIRSDPSASPSGNCRI